jgi:hypothetical protein
MSRETNRTAIISSHSNPIGPIYAPKKNAVYGQQEGYSRFRQIMEKHLRVPFDRVRQTLRFSDNMPRANLLFYALILQLTASAVSGIGFSVNKGPYWIAGVALWALWFLMIVAIVIPAQRTDSLLESYSKGIKKSASVIFLALVSLGLLELVGFFYDLPIAQQKNAGEDVVQSLIVMKQGFQYNDGSALELQAVDNLLSGENPYAHSNIISALLKYNGSLDRVTPLRVDRLANVFPYPTESQLAQICDSAITNPSQPPREIESRVCYPAGFFLLPAPFIAAGVSDIRIVYLVFVVAGLAYAAWKIPSKNRILFIAFAGASLELWNSLANAETGSLVFPLLLVAWVTVGKNNLLSAIAMGLAVATKQTAWFFLPFYLILLWNKSGLKPLLYSSGIISGTLIALNAYFLIVDPRLFLSSLLSPMTDPMFPLGVGIVSAVTAGVINIQSSFPFIIMEGVIFIGCIVWYWRNVSRYPLAGPILAVLPLFFAWRSLWGYFFYVQIIILATILLEVGERKAQKVLEYEN